MRMHKAFKQSNSHSKELERVIFAWRNVNATASKKYFRVNDEMLEYFLNGLNLYKGSKT